MLNDFLGDWKATKDVQTRIGVTGFTIPEGSIVCVTQIDEANQEAFVQAAPSLCGWKNLHFLNDFEPVT